MSFYSAISPWYDEIFPVDAAEMAFVAERLAGAPSLIDIGCGTGNKTAQLAAAGRSIAAVDGDPAMIAAARATNSRPGIAYAVLDMLEIDRAFAGRRFDAALCLGNTLVHLADPACIRGMLGTISGLLNAGGAACIQILNYDRILDKNITSLPLLETERIRFERSYVPRDGLLRFVTTLRVKATGEEIRNDIPLYPLRRAELAEGLTRAAFARVDWYGSYKGDPLTEDSLPLIALARK